MGRTGQMIKFLVRLSLDKRSALIYALQLTLCVQRFLSSIYTIVIVTKYSLAARMIMATLDSLKIHWQIGNGPDISR